jgi:hypothetical protein
MTQTDGIAMERQSFTVEKSLITLAPDGTTTYPELNLLVIKIVSITNILE